MNLYIFGGRPCTGKTTLAYHLGQKFNIHVEHADIFAQKCIDTSDEKTPCSFKLKNKTLVEAMSNEPSMLLQEYLDFYHEIFPELIREIENSDKDELILEGSIFLPVLIKDLEKKFNVNVCFMAADDTFVRKKYIKRDYVIDMLKTSHGKSSLENLLERDVLFNKYLMDELEYHSYPMVPVCENDFETEFNSVERIFGLI